MGFGQELKDFSKGFESGHQLYTEGRKSKAEWERIRQPTEEELAAMPGATGEGGAIPESSPDTGTGGSTAGADVAWDEADTHQRAFLNTLAGPESGGRYDVIYGGGKFNDFSKHPGKYVTIQSGPNRGQKSSAAGKYQFLESTWNDIAGRYRLKDFSPANQDKAAWILAAETYAQKTKGGSLLDTLKSGDATKVAQAGKILSPIWTSLPSGIEQGTTTDAFVSTFNKYLGESPDASAVASASEAEVQSPPKKDVAEPAIAEEEEEEEAPEERASQETAVNLMDVDEPEVTPWTEFAQLADQQLLGGPESPPVEQQARPALFAEEGGIIPEPGEINFAKGGTVDKYSPTRAYTQALPAVGGTGFVPRRVGAPPDTAGVVKVGGLTPSQIAFQKLRTPAPVAAAPAPAPVAPSYTDDQRIAANIAYNKVASGMGARSRAGPGSRGHEARKLSSAWGKQYSGDEGRTKWVDRYLTQKPGEQLRSSIWGFARGGSVPTVDPEYWEAAVKREASSSSRGGESARDIAAKRENVRRGGPVSSAIHVGPKGKAAIKTGGGKARPPGGPSREKTGSTERRILEDRETRDRSGGRILEDRETRDRSGGRILEDRETRDRSLRESVGRQGEPIRRQSVGRQGQPIPEPDIVQPPEQAARARGDVEENQIRARELRERLIRERDAPEPIPPTGRDRYEPPIAVQPLPRPDPTQIEPPQYPPNEPLPERFGPAEPEEPQGFWMNGQWVPYNPNEASYQAGGIIPEEDEVRTLSPRAEEAAYTTSARGAPSASSAAPPRPAAAPAAAPATVVEPEREYENVRPTKRLKDDVAKALDGGVRFLQRTFGLQGGGGAVPAPEDGAMREEGTQRFAAGEGAATPDEIAGIDDKIDPEKRLREDDRHMNRLAQTTQWYLSRGRKEEAEAAAAGLMQYGAKRFGQLGDLAGAAYRKYKDTGDPQALDDTTKFIEQAYRLIPDGSKLDVAIDPETGMIQATRVNPEGEEETYDVSPDQLEGIIASAQGASGYWKQIFRLADPEGARSQDISEREEKRGERTEKRQEERDIRLETFRQDREDTRYKQGLEKEERVSKAQQEKEERTEKRQEEKEARAEKRQEERWRREHPETDWGTVAPLMAETKTAFAAIEEADDTEAAQQVADEKASRLFDALSKTSKDPAKAMEGLGIYMDDFTYTEPPAPAAGGGADMDAAVKAQYPDAVKEGDSWVVTRDGKKFRVKPKGG